MKFNLFDKFAYLIMEHKLRLMFRIVFTILIIIPFLFFGSLNIYFTYNEMTNKALMHKEHESKLIAAIIKERLDGFLALSTSLAQRPYLKKHAEKKDWGQATQILSDITAAFPYIERIVLYNVEGKITGEIPSLGVIGESRKEMKWYKDFSKDFSPQITDVYKRKAAPYHNVISSIVPIYSFEKSKIIGILMLQVKLEHFYYWINNYYAKEGNEFVILLDRESQIVFHPTLDLDKQIYNYKDHPLAQNIQHNKHGAQIIFNKWDNETRLTGYRPIESYGWGVMISEPLKSAFHERSLEIEKQIIATLSSLLLFALLFFSYFIIFLQNKKIALELKEKGDAIIANKAKTEFVSNISHEIRTPLNAILGYTDYILETTKEGETKEYLVRISKAGQNLLSLINNILELSKIEAGINTLDLKPTHLSVLIYDTIEMVRERSQKKGLILKTNIEEDIKKSFIITDQLKLQRVVLNLLTNAVKFSDKGEITVNIIKRTNEASSAELIIEISDQGAGIPKEKIPLLFKRFSQVDGSASKKFEGTGLGLSICKEIIEFMGGKISVKSILYKGSIFTVEVPFIETSEIASVHPPEATSNKVSMENIRILLADDSDENRALIQVYLKNLPYSIDMASNGKEAIEKFQLNSYHLIFMDMQMPEIDGFEATKTIRGWEKQHKRRKTPIIALTGFALKEEQDRCYAAGCSLHVAKPVKRQELLNIIANYISLDIDHDDN